MADTGVPVCYVLGLCIGDDWVWWKDHAVAESVFVHGVLDADQCVFSSIVVSSQTYKRETLIYHSLHNAWSNLVQCCHILDSVEDVSVIS